MKKYACERCDAEIKPLVCAKCNVELADKVFDKDGKKIPVAECPKCSGTVKAPECCDAPMKSL